MKICIANFLEFRFWGIPDGIIIDLKVVILLKNSTKMKFLGVLVPKLEFICH
jgi:hypothetical protein